MNDPRNFCENFINKLESKKNMLRENKSFLEVDGKYLPPFAKSEILFLEVCKSLNNYSSLELNSKLIYNIAKQINEIIFDNLVENFTINIINNNLNEKFFHSLFEYFEDLKNIKKLNKTNLDDFYFITVFFETLSISGVTAFFNADKCRDDDYFKMYLMLKLSSSYILKLNEHLKFNSKFNTNVQEEFFKEKTFAFFKEHIFWRFKINV